MHSMKKVLCATVGSAALIAAGAATAAAPGAATGGGFSQWSFTPGVGFTNLSGTASLSTTCTTGFTCGAAIEEGGFFQRSITDTSTGQSYFQTIIVDDLAGITGDVTLQAFADENFVAQGVPGGGIADQQSVNDFLNSGMLAETAILTGWALENTATESRFKASQFLTTQPDANGEALLSTFNIDIRNNGDTAIDMDQTLKTGLLPTDDPATAGTPLQQFVFNKRSGSTFVTAARDALTATPDIFPTGGTDADGVTPKTDISWAVGDTVERVAIGQDIVAASQVFGYESWKSTAAGTGAVDFVKQLSDSTTPFLQAVGDSFSPVRGTTADPFL